MRRPVTGAVFAAALFVAACGSTPVATTSPAGNQLTIGCSDQRPCHFTAGTWVTTGKYAFTPGLAVTLPDGWSSHGNDAGELDLIPDERPNDVIFLWKDVVAIESNGDTPKVLADVPGTPEGLTASFRNNPDFVVSTPIDTTIAGGIPALTYVISVSPSAAYTSRGCPSYPACANILTDPVNFRADRFYAIGAPEVVRLYLATVGTAADRHTFVIGLDATDAAEVEPFTVLAAPIIASIRLPAKLGSP